MEPHMKWNCPRDVSQQILYKYCREETEQFFGPRSLLIWPQLEDPWGECPCRRPKVIPNEQPHRGLGPHQVKNIKSCRTSRSSRGKLHFTVQSWKTTNQHITFFYHILPNRVLKSIKWPDAIKMPTYNCCNRKNDQIPRGMQESANDTKALKATWDCLVPATPWCVCVGWLPGGAPSQHFAKNQCYQQADRQKKGRPVDLLGQL